jgi:hypothetical protein
MTCWQGERKAIQVSAKRVVTGPCLIQQRSNNPRTRPHLGRATAAAQQAADEAELQSVEPAQLCDAPRLLVADGGLAGARRPQEGNRLATRHAVEGALSCKRQGEGRARGDDHVHAGGCLHQMLHELAQPLLHADRGNGGWQGTACAYAGPQCKHSADASAPPHMACTKYARRASSGRGARGRCRLAGPPPQQRPAAAPRCRGPAGRRPGPRCRAAAPEATAAGRPATTRRWRARHCPARG